MGFLNKNFRMDKIRIYDRFVSLGLNCEISFILYTIYGGVESSLFQWASVPSVNFLEVLNNLSLIYSGKVIENKEVNMWKCAVTSIAFHGKSLPHQLLDEHGKRDSEKVRAELKETIKRIQYLRDKFRIIAQSAETKLYILGLHPNFYSDTKEKAVRFLQEIYTTLQKIAKNASLLVILEEKMQTKDIMQLDDNTAFFIRCIDHFAPMLKATSHEEMDLQGYMKIFLEFYPDKLSKNEKKFKFEME